MSSQSIDKSGILAEIKYNERKRVLLYREKTAMQIVAVEIFK